MNTQAWIDTAAAAKYAGMSPRVLAKLARQKKIKAGSDGRHWKFLPEFIDAWLIANARGR